MDSEQKISDLAGGFTGVLDNIEAFGQSVANMGDLDGDGVDDLAVGAHLDDDGGMDRGAVWILFMNADGTVDSEQKISDTAGGFTGVLDNSDFFGGSLANMGDLDGDGVTDLAVGAFGDDDGGTDRGAVWILFLNADGTVDSEQKISDTAGSFTGTLDNIDQFGQSVANMGDLDGDGVDDLAVGAVSDDDGGDGRGAVWILFLKADGTVKAHQKISDTAGGFMGVLDNSDQFGQSVANMGDLDGNGVTDLAVGAIGDDDGGDARGAVWILFLNADGTVDSHQKISDTTGGFTGVLSNVDEFGFSVANMGDLDGSGVTDLAVGARSDDDGGDRRGAVWILFLNSNGTVDSHQKISDTEGGFTGVLDNSDDFGWSVANMGDLDGDGVNDLAVGARGDDDGGTDRGAVWILFLSAVPMGPCEVKLFGNSSTKVYACDVKKDTSGVKAPIKNQCYTFEFDVFGVSAGDFSYTADRPRDADMACSCEPTGFNTIVNDDSKFFLCLGTALNPFTANYEPAGFRGKAFIRKGVRRIFGDFQMGRDVWKIRCRINNATCPQIVP